MSQKERPLVLVDDEVASWVDKAGRVIETRVWTAEALLAKKAVICSYLAACSDTRDILVRCLAAFAEELGRSARLRRG